MSARDGAMNTERFLADPRKYFATSYEQFVAFGGPCVYFHRECLRAGETEFLSQRHVETLYATLASWGMHRLGRADKTKTRLTSWDEFHASIVANASRLTEFREFRLLGMAAAEYGAAVARLRPIYETLSLSVSGATVVVNSKALHHLLPEFIPPIDRQYTIRFLTQSPDRWRDAKGKYRLISLPRGIEAQFCLFQRSCTDLKRLADRIDPTLFAEETQKYGVLPPKALDNAIVNYVRLVGGKPL